jgi:hypothetical protein
MRAAVVPELRPLLLAMAQHWNEFAERAEHRDLPAPPSAPSGEWP